MHILENDTYQQSLCVPKWPRRVFHKVTSKGFSLDFCPVGSGREKSKILKKMKYILFFSLWTRSWKSVNTAFTIYKATGYPKSESPHSQPRNVLSCSFRFTTSRIPFRSIIIGPMLTTWMACGTSFKVNLTLFGQRLRIVGLYRTQQVCIVLFVVRSFTFVCWWTFLACGRS